MKSKRIPLTANPDPRALLLCLTLIATAGALTVHAQQTPTPTPRRYAAYMAAPLRPWVIYHNNRPVRTMDIRLVRGLQIIAQKWTHMDFRSEIPLILQQAAPGNKGHRQLLGLVKQLPNDFKDRVLQAVAMSNEVDQKNLILLLDSLYEEQNVSGQIEKLVDARADELLSMMGGDFNLDQIVAADLELRPFTTISSKARKIHELAAKAREGDTMDMARRMAWALMKKYDIHPDAPGRDVLQEGDPRLSSKSRAELATAEYELRRRLSELAADYRLAGNAYFLNYKFEDAIVVYEKALEFINPNNDAYDWALIMKDIGQAKQMLAFRAQNPDDRKSWAKASNDAYLKALSVFTEKDFPPMWREIQASLKKTRDWMRD